MTHKTQINFRIPNIDSLCCINCKINPVDMQQDPLIKSLFHSQILTCRLIIYTLRCCIASPSIQNADDLIHIVVNKSFYDSGKLQEHLSKLNVYYTDPEPVHPKIYEACLKYTFTFRLAPHWNLIGKSFYLQGFNFLSLTSNINAAEWNILFNDSNDVKLELVPIKMNLFPLTLDSLSLPSKAVDGFTLNRNINSIDLTSFESPWVYVLPKLTRARIVSVSKTLPESCPFQNYNDLRRHWKNMYSYRLPKNEQGLLFYEVIFPSQPNQYFTYPETCILFKMPEILMSDNKNEVASQFIKDFSTNVHSVCGEIIQIGHLYPELDIEYTCTLRKRTCGNQSSQLQQSSYFKTPTESTVNPVNGKINLSSLFTFQGMNKMKPEMLSHSQKVLSIMQNNNRKRKPTKEDENEYLIQSMSNCKKRKFGMSQDQDCMPSIKPEKTVVDNLEDVISYYDIPSMCPENKELDRITNQDTSLKQNEHIKSINLMSQLHRPKPIIKNVENLHFDLRGIQSPINFDELSINKNKTNEGNKGLLDKNNCDATHSAKISNSIEKENEPENLVSDQPQEELCKSPSLDEYNVYRKLKSSIHSINLDDKVLSELLPRKTNDKPVESTETQSYDQEIRTFLSSFGSNNNHEHDEIDVKKQLYEQYKKTPATSDVNNKTSSNKTLIKKALKTSLEQTEFSEISRNNLKYDMGHDNQPDKSSESSLYFRTRPDTDVCHTNPREIFKKSNKEYIEPEDYSVKKNLFLKNSYESCHQAMTKISTDPEKVFQPKNGEEKSFETPQISALSYKTFEESVNRKPLRNCGTPIDKESLGKKFKNMQDSDYAQNSKTINNEKSSGEFQGSSLTFGNLQNSCQTPSLNSILKTAGDLEHVNEFNNTPQYSTDQFQLRSDVQSENLLYKKDINEYVDQSDFLSILSESSNGSDTGDYESCKLVFEEALTLKK